MGDFDRGELFVRVKDRSGEEFVCPLKALRNPKELSPEERGPMRGQRHGWPLRRGHQSRRKEID